MPSRDRSTQPGYIRRRPLRAGAAAIVGARNVHEVRLPNGTWAQTLLGPDDAARICRRYKLTPIRDTPEAWEA